MKKRLLCALLALALCLGLPAAAAEDMALTVAGVTGDTPYLICGELTATTEDYIKAVADVGNGLLAACTQRDIPFQESPVSLELSGVLSVRKKAGFLWDNTIDGVPFDQYLEEKAQTLAFYRAWSESGLSPQSTAETFAVWGRESGYLRFAYFPVKEKVQARTVYEALCRGEDMEALWGGYSLTPDAPMEYAGPPERFLPAVTKILTEAPTEVWQKPIWVDNGYQPHFAVFRRLPLTPEIHRQALLEEAWPTAIDSGDIRLAGGAERLDPTALYEKWLAWAVSHDKLIVTTQWTTIDGEAVILSGGEAEVLPVPGGTGFSDVAETDWFAPYVAVCVEEGLMEGTGEGTFFPQRTLTAQECTVLALRLYDIQRGGDGTFSPPPEDWGQMTLTAGDLTQTGYLRGFRTFPQWWAENAAPWNAPALWLDDKARAAQMDGMEALVTYAGVEYPGRLQRKDDPTWSAACLVFCPDDPAAFRYVSDSYEFLPVDWEGQWLKNAWYYGDVHGLRDTPLFPQGLYGDTRLAFARALAYAVGEPEPVNTIPSLPDLPREGNEDIYGLYEAGILTGADETGAFAGERTLTRAEAAAVLARTLRPQLRAGTPPPDPAVILGRDPE